MAGAQHAESTHLQLMNGSWAFCVLISCDLCYEERGVAEKRLAEVEERADDHPPQSEEDSEDDEYHCELKEARLAVKKATYLYR